MLTPSYLRDLPDPIVNLFHAVEDDILADMARRIVQYNGWTASVDWQNDRLREAGLMQDEILGALAQKSGVVQRELQRLMEAAGTEALRADRKIYIAAGLRAQPSERLTQILNAGFRATMGEMRNICRTTARTATQQFTYALDRCWLQIQSGAFDQNTAVQRAVEDLAAHGVSAVRYPSGRTDSIEVAVRRAVQTGVNQTCGQLQEELADEVGCDLVEVSAHAGARPEHALWQGKIYSRSGKSDKYPDFRASTGYGTGGGLCGWNCRHSFAPYVEGAPRIYSDDDLAEMNAPKYEYNGKKLTEYEAQQQQRANERQIRRWQREYVTKNAAGLDTSEASVKLGAARAKQTDFLGKTGLKRQSRELAGGFGVRQATTAAREAVQYYQNWSRSIGVNDSIKTLAKYYDVKYNDSPRFVLLQGYARAIENADILPLVGFEEYERVNAELQKRVIGITAKNGVVIESFATHFIDRVIGQTSTPHAGMRCGVSIDSVIDTLTNPKGFEAVRNMPDGDVRQTLKGSTSKVTISIRDKRLIQTNPRSGE